MTPTNSFPWWLTRRALFAVIGIVLPITIVLTLSNFVSKHPDYAAGASGLGVFGVLVPLCIGALGIAAAEE